MKKKGIKPLAATKTNDNTRAYFTRPIINRISLVAMLKNRRISCLRRAADRKKKQCDQLPIIEVKQHLM